MNKLLIQQTVRRVKKELWEQRVALGIDAGSRVNALHPSLGAAALGIRFDIDDHLDRSGIAGLLDRNGRRIAVARRYPFITQRFTGAHELGHFALHSKLVMHRDRPIEGTAASYSKREPEEQEADYFAAFYLMPENLVSEEFARRFGVRKPLPVDDNVAYWFSPNEPEAFLYGTPRERAAMIATRANRGQFDSLAAYFHVSVSSMAIQLLEFGLVD